MMNQTNIYETPNKEELIQELLKCGIYKKYDKSYMNFPFLFLNENSTM
ncbi:hypothetical protein [Bacillus cihuensis]|nr:hypothetical protein [Bacillus cihuensis]